MKSTLITLIAALVCLPVHGAEAVEEPIKVDACELLTNTIAYHRKLVRVEARVSRGFEDFSLRGKACPDLLTVWLEYGGPEPAKVIYCCVGEQSHPPNGRDSLVVDGITTSLVRDMRFMDFDSKTKLLRRHQTVRAVIIGRVFAKKAYETGSDDDLMAGFGHFGMSSLLVIQKIERVW
jgi:hypothetical protein